MAAMATALVVKSINGSSITYTLPAHTALKPALVVQNTQPAISGKQVSGDTVRISLTAVDAAGIPLASRSSVEVVVKRSAYGTGAELASLKTLAQDIFMSDEFWNNVYDDSSFIKPV